MVEFARAEVTYRERHKANRILSKTNEGVKEYKAYIPMRKRMRKRVIKEWEDSLEELQYITTSPQTKEKLIYKIKKTNDQRRKEKKQEKREYNLREDKEQWEEKQKRYKKPGTEIEEEHTRKLYRKRFALLTTEREEIKEWDETEPNIEHKRFRSIHAYDSKSAEIEKYERREARREQEQRKAEWE
ncbi:hypothetical protein ANTPLA_LOCUS8106 [Anthophora plagiata]